MRQSLILHGLALLLLLGFGDVRSQTEKALFKRDLLPVVAPASTFIEEAQGNRAFPLGSTVVLTRRRSKAAADIHSKALQARMFRLAATGPAVPDPWHTIGDCDIYYTNSISITTPSSQADNALPLGKFDDDAWLSPNALTGHMEQGRYLVVFEQSIDAQRVFRLQRGDREQYFKQGYILVLDPSPTRSYSSTDVKAIHDRLESSRSKVEAEAKRNDPAYVCYRFQAVSPALKETEGSTLALIPCESYGAVEAASVP